MLSPTVMADSDAVWPARREVRAGRAARVVVGYLSSPSRPVEAGTDGLTLAIEPLRT